MKSFLAVDFGAGSLKLAEFEVNETGGLRLKQYVIKSLGAEGSQESKREAVVLKALQEVIAEKGIKAKTVNVSAPGFHVFSKFVKLPPVESGKVTQMIQYEAQQNVPFPLEEVVWDYQILGTTPGGELEVLLVAIKAEVVEGLFRVTEEAGLSLQLTDVSPAALCNAFRYNYGELEDCTALLDIGAKTSNLLFFEKGKVFSRSINLGANTITQDFANEAKMKFDVAEKIKVAEGFVSLGGAYQEPENPHQAAISKIARQFMTRLHIQVNQTMQFYRGQQGGSAPQRLFLSGGASIMPYTAQFFAEKLNVPVEYFNPFRNVQIDPSVNLEELARVAHSLGEVVGLGLRNLAQCPVELNLMPESTLRWQRFNQKKPYFIATVFSLVAVAFAVGLLFQKLAGLKEEELKKLEPEVKRRQAQEGKFKKAFADLKKNQLEVNQLTTWMEERFYWARILEELRHSLIHVEDATKQRLGTDAGVWIEQFIPVVGTSAAPPSPNPGGGGEGSGTPPPPAGPPEGSLPGAEGAPPAAAPPQQPASPGQIATVTLICRAVSLSHVSPSANTDIAFALQKELQANPLFDSKETQLTGQINTDDATSGTFVFGVTLALKHPLKL